MDLHQTLYHKWVVTYILVTVMYVLLYSARTLIFYLALSYMYIPILLYANVYSFMNSVHMGR